MTLQQLKEKYGIELAKREPNPSCKFCKGTGEKRRKKNGELTFCICLFVDHKASDEIGDMLGQFAKDQLKKMDNAR